MQLEAFGYDFVFLRPLGGYAFPAAITALFANTRTISRRYYGVSIEVVSGFAVCAASSATT